MNTVPQIKTVRNVYPELFEQKPRRPALLIPCQFPFIPYDNGDELVHGPERPFCDDPDCPCHVDYHLWQEVIGNPVRDGIMTYEEGQRLFTGQQF